MPETRPAYPAYNQATAAFSHLRNHFPPDLIIEFIKQAKEGIVPTGIARLEALYAQAGQIVQEQLKNTPWFTSASLQDQKIIEVARAKHSPPSVSDTGKYWSIWQDAFNQIKANCGNMPWGDQITNSLSPDPITRENASAAYRETCSNTEAREAATDVLRQGTITHQNNGEGETYEELVETSTGIPTRMTGRLIEFCKEIVPQLVERKIALNQAQETQLPFESLYSSPPEEYIPTSNPVQTVKCLLHKIGRSDAADLLEEMSQAGRIIFKAKTGSSQVVPQERGELPWIWISDNGFKTTQALAHELGHVLVTKSNLEKFGSSYAAEPPYSLSEFHPILLESMIVDEELSKEGLTTTQRRALLENELNQQLLFFGQLGSDLNAQRNLYNLSFAELEKDEKINSTVVASYKEIMGEKADIYDYCWLSRRLYISRPDFMPPSYIIGKILALHYMKELKLATDDTHREKIWREINSVTDQGALSSIEPALLEKAMATAKESIENILAELARTPSPTPSLS